MVFTYTPFEVIPAYCELTVSCTSVSSPAASESEIACQDFALDGTLTHSFDSDDYKAGLSPGIHRFIITVSSGGEDDDLNPTFNFDLELIDPCFEASVDVSGVSD